MKKLILLLPLLALIGCTPVERQAYRAIVGAKAFLDYVKSKHPECPASNADPCPYLLKATLSKDLLIDAVNVYCASDTWDKGGNCTPPTNKNVRQQAEAKLKGMIAVYAQAEADLRSVLK